DPAGQQADYCRDPVLRCQGGDRGRSVGRQPGRLQHAGGRVAQPILRLSQLWQDFQRARISVDRLGDIPNAPAEPEHNPNRASLPPIKGAITFDKVRFRYRPDAAEALRGVSLEIAPGEMLGIVGPSGSGKSTLTKLVQRLYVPEQGRVLVDGTDLAL